MVNTDQNSACNMGLNFSIRKTGDEPAIAKVNNQCGHHHDNKCPEQDRGEYLQAYQAKELRMIQQA
jgi:hypothetical protein